MQILETEIISIDAEKIRPLRHAELRKGQDFSTTSYLKDYEVDTFHMGCIVDDKIVTLNKFTFNICSENYFTPN